MATVSITEWREDGTVWSGWAEHAKAELRRRLRRIPDLSPAVRRDLERRIKRRELVCLGAVDPGAVESLRHILEALGANVAVEQ